MSRERIGYAPRIPLCFRTLAGGGYQIAAATGLAARSLKVIASLLQTMRHIPHPAHRSGSMTTFSCAALQPMAPYWQTRMHCRQPLHNSGSTAATYSALKSDFTPPPSVERSAPQSDRSQLQMPTMNGVGRVHTECRQPSRACSRSLSTASSLVNTSRPEVSGPAR